MYACGGENKKGGGTWVMGKKGEGKRKEKKKEKGLNIYIYILYFFVCYVKIC
jgi:hypothetical protein